MQAKDKNSPQLWPFYLEADPERQAVLRYLPQSRVYLLVEQALPMAVACVLPLTPTICELKNITVCRHRRRQNLGTLLCQYIFEECRQQGFVKLLVGTADVSCAPLAFYQQLGFTRTTVITNFFIDNYATPIYDNGELCRNMIILEKCLVGKGNPSNIG